MMPGSRRPCRFVTLTRIALALTQALSLAIAAAGGIACATGGGLVRPYPGGAGRPPASVPPAPATEPVPAAKPAPAAEPAPAAATVPRVAHIVELALMLQGAPYRDGGSDPSGFDCSGLVYYVFTESGVTLPRSARDQYTAGSPVGAGNIAAGDLLFFATNGSGPTHVAIAIDAVRFVHAPNERTVVRVDALDTPYWRLRLIGARRVR